MIQIDSGVVPMKDIPNPMIVACVQRLHHLSIRRPGLRVIGCGLAPGYRAVGNLGQFPLASLLAPAHPLWACLQFFQGWYLSCVRNVCLWLHSSAAFPAVIVMYVRTNI